MIERKAMTQRSPADRHLWQITPVRDLVAIGLILFILWAGYSLRSIFTPVLVGLLFAYLFSPLITYTHTHWRFPRPLTISLLFVLLIAIGAGLIGWLGPIVENQVITLAQKAPTYLESLAQRYNIDIENPRQQLQDAAATMKMNAMSLIKAALTGTSQAFGFLGSVVSATTYFLISSALIPVYFFFFAWHFPSMIHYIQEYVPSSRQDRIAEIVERMDQAVGSFFRGRLVIAVMMGTMLSIGWLIVDVPYWFLLGIGTGLLSIVPYGATFGWPLAVLLKYLDVTTGSGAPGFDWAAVVFWPSVVYGVVQLLEGWVLTPYVQSQSTELSAVTILIVVFIGGAVGGLYGLILAIPLTACLKILFQEVVLVRLKQWAAEN
ncbi:AI-2E family transporter [Nitrospira sp. M1]